MRFLGLGLGDALPDAKTIWTPLKTPFCGLFCRHYWPVMLKYLKYYALLGGAVPKNISTLWGF